MNAGSSTAASVPPLPTTTAFAAAMVAALSGACAFTSTPYIEVTVAAGAAIRATRSTSGRTRRTRFRMWRLANRSSSLKPS
jgi:hypothetical protein